MATSVSTRYCPDQTVSMSRNSPRRSTALHGSEFLDIPLKELGYSSQTVEKLAKMNLTAIRHLLSTPIIELRNAGFRKEEAEAIFQAAVARKYGTLDDASLFSMHGTAAANPQPRLSFGCKNLDAAFEGGIMTGTLTEITGAAGTGKSQFALQLCCACQKLTENGGISSAAIYVCTETVSIKRMKQLAEAHGASMDRILIQEQLHDFIRSDRLHNELANGAIQLLVLDSITNVFRYVSEPGRNSYDTSQKTQKLAGALKHLISKFNITVVCTNQVTSDFSPNEEGRSNQDPVPCLGVTWANFVTMRIVLRKFYKRALGEDSAELKRTLRIEFSSYLPRRLVEYEISNGGISAICSTWIEV